MPKCLKSNFLSIPIVLLMASWTQVDYYTGLLRGPLA